MSHPRTFSPDRLRALRKQVGLSREALAHAIGRSYMQVGNYERGQQRPPAEVLDEIARVLGCTRDDLLSEDGAHV